uniref:hypothetical protein n=1 Tax=Trichocoleus desertorum TaxID=1481672 RepID=UPI0025B3F121|nr:hypothetical protein [Trichocoleus desertorum]
MTITQPLIKQFPCPGCGASLQFNPQAGQLKCPYCGREEIIPQSAEQVVERSYEEYLNPGRAKMAVLSATAMEVACPGCRAQIEFEPPDVAGLCPFCSTSIVAQPQVADPLIAPEAVLPFSVGQKAAREKIHHWLGSLWFAPNSLKKMAQHEGLQGMYLPFWAYDSFTVSHYRGERGTYYYVTETYQETDSEGKTVTKTRQVRHTRWNSVSGRVDRFFDDLLVAASQSVDLERLEELEPWDLSRLAPYNPSFLAGFKAQRYQVSLQEGFETAKAKMAPVIHSDVCCNIGGDEQRVHSVSTAYSAITFKHILLPVWLSAYRFNNKQYQVMVNAQTGEVLGDRPYSIFKITLAVLSGLAIAAGTWFGIDAYQQRQLPQPEPVTAPALSDPAVSPELSTTTPTPSPKAAPARSSKPTDANDPFRQAINRATQASTLGQSAETEGDWSTVASQWNQAILLLEEVPPDSANYETAQTKLQEYQRNFNYAKQQQAKTAP